MTDRDLSRGAMETLAMSALAEILADSEASPSARASAARTVLELSGKVGGRSKAQGTEKMPEQMNLSDINAELERLSG